MTDTVHKHGKRDLRRINADTARKMRFSVIGALIAGVAFYFAHDALTATKKEKTEAQSKALSALEHSQHDLRLLYEQISEYKKRGQDYNQILEGGLIGQIEKTSVADRIAKFMQTFSASGRYSFNIKEDVMIDKKRFKKLAELPLKKKSIFYYTPISINAFYLTDDAPFRLASYMSKEISKYNLMNQCSFTLLHVKSIETGNVFQTQVVTRCDYDYVHATPRKIASLSKGAKK